VLLTLLGRVRQPKVLLAVFAAAAGFVVVLVGVAFLVDEARTSGHVARNVQVAGRDVSGYSRERLVRAIDDVSSRYAATEVVIRVDGAEDIRTEARKVGLRIDPVATTPKVLTAGRTGGLPRRWASWLAGFSGDRRADVRFEVDRVALDLFAAEWGKGGPSPLVEAHIAIGTRGRFEGKFVGLPGQSGQSLHTEDLAKVLPQAAGKGSPVMVTATRADAGPRFTEADAEEAASRAEALVATSLPIVVGTTAGSLSAAAMRQVITSVPGRDRLELTVDPERAAVVATAAMAEAISPPTEPAFTVDPTGAPVLVPGVRGKACCSPPVAQALAAAILQRPSEPVRLDLVDRMPKTSDAAMAGLGVKEMVATFSTKHPAGQPRVTNIHRIADILRGYVILPGATLSVNGFVGKRSEQNGFVVDRAIADGEFVEDVGGGVSQFATTLFNAAWFGGLEFGEYQSHTLYIGRYPRGRDATLGFPHPDLTITNPTPYGILIWPTYTDTEITVSLYSTKWVTVEAAGQSRVKVGSCTAYINRRKRLFLDGRVAEDTTRARYRAARGQDCGETKPSPGVSATKPRA